ncbi:MAG: hypothetical protein A2622_03935 [Bdellovibrionales bacterium RIFCSPHIGHO2_01_FULL_40_29]|nr:MAG: hypothetical protein A2622_03935 [Bdellovibrionales bacterium RIFCSPHIGHO2_01_FULL_40_29]OFZ35336.1 MAG: hypothetical protein A3D17_08095 [Bdellovibrionales bacterium RIFCSPHIGHO2_02_FULL_40_15]
MKKFLFLFVVLDFVFVALIIKWTTTPGRMIASTEQSFYSDLTDGQKNKWDLIETFQFDSNSNHLEFSTNKLQMICETSSLIELQYAAQNVAFAGQRPTITHIFSCENIRKNQDQSILLTLTSDFTKIHKTKKITYPDSQLVGSQLYADEEFPTHWKLAEVRVKGPNTFTINEFEIEKVHGHALEFSISVK